MSLASRLSDLYEELHRTIPPSLSKTIKSSTAEFKASFDMEQVVKAGAPFPDFSLRDTSGHKVFRDTLLERGPLLIAFYGGGWCPYCSLELRELQAHVADFAARGVTLVAVSPELPDQSLSLVEKEQLKFLVLSDEGNQLARRLGIVFKQPESMRAIFASGSVDLRARNGVTLNWMDALGKDDSGRAL